jgi:hypothetical protein
MPKCNARDAISGAFDPSIGSWDHQDASDDDCRERDH